jgi:hypothetical protein
MSVREGGCGGTQNPRKNDDTAARPSRIGILQMDPVDLENRLSRARLSAEIFGRWLASQ